MKEQDALLAAVLDAPDDDAPRLVYADWLDEHGQPDRAEFIRVQIERARLPPDDPRAQALEAREAALVRTHREAWLKELPAWTRSYCVHQRGFAASVKATAREFLKGAAGLFRRAPIRRVELRHLDNATAVLLAASPHLAKVSAFEVGDNSLTSAGWRALLAAPWLAHVTGLRLYGGALDPAAAHVLASSPHLSQLTSLVLHGGQVGDLGLQDLADSPNMARLTTLHVCYNGISDEGARALAASPNLANLADLDLAFNAIGDAGVRALADAPHLGRLVRLGLMATGITEQGARALAASPYLTGLKSVVLASITFTAEARERIRKILGPRCSF
jgi:uncharacterized protein (TIGR02996 family)